jgi:antitoxin ParD1/3/4
MNVSLTSELERFVEDRVKSGAFASSNEVVRAGLRLLAMRESTFGKLKTLLLEADKDMESQKFQRFENTDQIFDKVKRLVNLKRGFGSTHLARSSGH